MADITNRAQVRPRDPSMYSTWAAPAEEAESSGDMGLNFHPHRALVPP
jgi:hypothetical protein